MWSVACPSISFCVAGESSNSNHALDVATTATPTGAATGWTQRTISTGTDEAGAYVLVLSCPSTTLCAGTDGGQDVITSSAPTSGAFTYTDLSSIDPNDITNISCTQTPTTLCVAVDNAGDVITSTDPTGGASAWTLDNVDDTNQMSSVFCESSSVCVAGDSQGDELNLYPTSTPPVNTLTVDLAGTGSGTVTSSPAGISCSKACSKSFAYGTKLALTATPAAGSKFGGWSGGGCSGTGGCTLTLSATTTVTAKFTKSASGTKLSHTKITKARIDAKKHTASFNFRATGATGYQYALIAPAKKGHKPKSPKFGSCRSPKSYTKLKAGKYKFEVRGHSGQGADSKPATKAFTIK